MRAYRQDSVDVRVGLQAGSRTGRDGGRVVRAVYQLGRDRLAITVTTVVQRGVVGFLDEAQSLGCTLGLGTRTGSLTSQELGLTNVH